ncbi:hypothetical protein ACFIQF_15215 [Comamonas sp. J-3]
MAAVLAHIVIEIGLIDLLTDTPTDFLADSAANDTTDECAEQ